MLTTATETTKSAHEISRDTIGAALKVHSVLGPGLLESAYETCLAYQLRKQGLTAQSQVALPVVYDGVHLDVGYRIDLLVEDLVVVELKACDAIHPIHEAQLLSCLKLSKKSLGLIINFHAVHLKDGIRRFVNGQSWK